jgi:hypothetical protein
MTTAALNSPPERGWMTVGELRAALETLPDDAPMFVDGNPDRSIEFAYPTQQIHPDVVSSWTAGDPLVPGLEVWLADVDGPDNELFADWRCRHGSKRAPSSSATRLAFDALGRLFDQTYSTAGDYAGRRRARTDRDLVMRVLEQADPGEPCGQVSALLVGRLSGPCTVRGRHTDHRADNGDTWTESVR